MATWPSAAILGTVRQLRKGPAVLETLEITLGAIVAVLALAAFAVMIWANARVDGARPSRR